jgi:iron complex outermembrane receptor protein
MWRLICIVSIVPTAVSQDQRATVRVEVKAENTAVAGAEVIVNGSRIQTDQNGIASLPVRLGPVKIAVTKAGFLPANTSLIIDEAREWVVTLELKQQETVEEQVTVYATRTDRRLQDTPLRVEVLNREEIEEKMMMTPGDIVMLLNEMGGLRVQTTSPALGAASVRVQGMPGRYTRFLSDGLPLFGQQGAGLGLLQMPPMDLAQVEVIKGAASALNGSGAMAGIVNLVSRRPRERPIREFLVNRSTLGATDATVFMGSRLSPHWSATFLGGGHGQQRNDIDKDGWADLAGYSRGVVRPRFFWDGGNGRTAQLTGGIIAEVRKGGTTDGAVLPATGAAYREALNTQRYDLGGNVQFLLNRYVVTSRFAMSVQAHRHQFGEVIERDRHDLWFGESAIRGTNGRNTWVAGLAVERDSYRPRDVRRFAYTYVVPGIFLQDDIDIARWLSVSASARIDFHNQYGTFFSPRVSALLRAAGWTSRVSLGQGFFAPTPLTEETEAAGLSRLSIPRPLLAERGRSGSIDLTRSAGPLSFTATLFQSNIRHPIHVVREERYEIVNLPAATNNSGFELLATWRKEPFSATASYMFVNARQTESGRRVDVPLTPKQSIGLVGMWEKEGAGRLGIECYYTGRQRLEQNSFRDVSRPYVIFGIMGERRFAKHYRLFLNLENLTNVRQTRWDPLLRPSRGADGRWTVDAWAPLEGRVINGGVRLVF